EISGILVCGLVWWLLSEAPLRGIWMIVAGGASATVFMLACGLTGRLLSRLVRERSLLLAVLFTAAIADVFTVSVGPTRHALDRAPQVVRRLSMALPEPGSAAGKRGAAGLAIAASIGLGDIIFGAMFLAAAARHGLNTSGGAATATVLAVGAMSLVLLVRQVPELPLLPFIAAGVMLPNIRAFELSRQEAIQLAIGGLFLATLLAAIYAAFR
ncbi:MAG: hypothetical protein H5T86_14480, partial [Armatimonadetes bacterium]|nr:hypothetical protein [Armatimonadota bacterium]